MKAQCQCGGLRADIAGGAQPLTIACHCAQCQRRSGSPFGVLAYFLKELVQIEGEAREFTRGSFLGTSVTNGFCPECGSTVYVLLEKNPMMTGIPVGAFADSEFPTPAIAVWEQEKHHWVELPDGIHRFVRGTDGK